MERQRLIGNIGAWSAAHPRLVIAVWLIAIAGGLLGLATSGHKLTSAVTILDDGESRRGGDEIDRHLANPDHASTQVLCATGPDGPVPLALLTVGGTNADASDIAWCYENKWGVANEREPDAAAPTLRIGMPDDLGEGEPADIVRQLLPVGLATGDDESRMHEAGAAPLRTVLQEDLVRAEIIALPLTLLILVLFVGPSPRALAPLIVGAGAFAVAAGIVSLLAIRWSISVYTINMIAMLGLATSIDYTLLVLQRERDETRDGAPARRAIVAAQATAGRTVAISGLTVMLALAAMAPMPISVVRELALGAMLAVALGIGAILTFLPAVLSILGPPNVGHAAGSRSSRWTPWRRWATVVTDHPAAIAAIVLAALVVLAGQATRLQTQLSPLSGGGDTSATVSTSPAYWQRQANITLRSVVEIVVDKPSAVGDGVDRLIAEIGHDNDFAPIVTMQTSDDGSLTVIRALVVRPSSSAEAGEALDRLRNDLVPAAFQVDTASIFVTGPLAQGRSVVHLFALWEPRIALLVLTASFFVLAVVFRSVVLPLVAILASLLSVAGTLGVLVLVVQEGHGAALLGIPSGSPIEIWVPVSLFAILFGLSMDYHIFLLSCVTERFRETSDVRDAVITGVASTGRVIAAGALVMMVVFASFATGRLVLLQQLGLGLAVAVMIDAFAIRLILIPAVTMLLGVRTWWAPAWLARGAPVSGHRP